MSVISKFILVNGEAALDKAAADAVSHDNSADASEDLLLVERIKAGEIKAFNLLVKKHQKRLYYVIYNLTSSKEDATDLTQEAFVKAFQSINKFKGNSAFYTWLYRIAVNTTITFLKKNRKGRFFSLEKISEKEIDEDFVVSLSSKLRTEKPILLKELQEKLNESLQMLSLKHRTVVVLFEIEGLSHSEIAKVLKCSEGTVRSRLHYAKEQLKQLLKKYLED